MTVRDADEGLAMPLAPPRPCRHCRKATTEKGGYCPACKAPLAAKRLATEPGRQWYGTKEWRALRDQVRLEEPLCVECLKLERVEPTTQVDHIVPHRGDKAKFFDRANLQGLCDTHHSRKTATEVNARR
jgi:5-methylcytosine-specific restriction protein A